MAIQVRPSGPIPAECMIVGEAPGADEERQGEPFVGASGFELTRMLHDAQINRTQCFITNVARERPFKNEIENFIAKSKKFVTPEHRKLRDKWCTRQVIEGFDLLKREIEMVKPKMVIALGNTAMWAMTGKTGILKWRGSMLYCDFAPTIRVIPTIHPAMILREWSYRAMGVNDLRRAADHIRQPYPDPGWRFKVRPQLSEVLQQLERLRQAAEERMPAAQAAAGGEAGAGGKQLDISFDLETRAGHIACAGLSWSLQDALSIPLMCVERREGYWTEDEEAQIVWELRRLLTHPMVRTVGQNLLYDCQYTYRWWGFVPATVRDTMISHHVAYAGLKKSLAFQASMYCKHYVYWKDDGKVWDKKMGEDSLWTYNCEDCVRTQECSDVEEKIVKQMGLADVDAAQQEMFWPVLRAMQLGVRIDHKARSKMADELLEEMFKREEWFTYVLGHTINPRSPKQMQALFYDDLKMPVQKNRKTGKPTLNEEGLEKIALREPLLRPLVKTITEYRSLGVFLSTFVKAPLDHDGRMRTSYNICGTETYRLSSSENAFGSGANLQNIPKGGGGADDLQLPNIRKIFVPDPGYEFFDLDLDRADLQVVVWEADDADLKAALRLGVDMHCFNALGVYRIKGIPVEELVESHPNYKEHRARIGEDKRQRTKSAVHAVDYACKGRTLAITLGCTVAEADDFIARWFAAHPGIRNWHQRIETQLQSKRKVRNQYGYERFYFDRIEGMLPEALAWIPQSTVAVTINRIWKNIYKNLPEVQVLLQGHDSIAGQFPFGCDTARIKQQAQVTIPYPDPLIIPVGIKTSRVSWGDCK